MLSSVLSCALHGIDALMVEVEVDIAHGIPQFALVGLPETAVKESRERVRAALKNSGYEFPSRRITVNLAPANVKKEGSAFDLPIALGILAASALLPAERLAGYVLVGELSLDGRVKPIRGALPIATTAAAQGTRGLLLPPANAAEAAVVQGIDVFPVETLSAAFEFLRGEMAIQPLRVELPPVFNTPHTGDVDFSEVQGQEHVKRALEVAAAGGHNVLMIGPPGSGKTMLARRLPTILPALALCEAIETSRVHSVVGLMAGRPLIQVRPFRSPHHTVSDAGLVGGGSIPRPGEVSLAHNGVLFLDELPEFKGSVLEVLRQPLEERRVTITRAAGSFVYPANIMLVAASNPCKCGNLGDAHRACICSPQEVHRYRSRISGPLLDRIDIHVEVPAVRYKDLSDRAPAESSALIRTRVEAARAVQLERFGKRKIYCNAQMGSRDLHAHCMLGGDAERLLETAMNRLHLSARAYTRILKVARTIADLDDAQTIGAPHISEAIQYRSLDRVQ